MIQLKINKEINPSWKRERERERYIFVDSNCNVIALQLDDAEDERWLRRRAWRYRKSGTKSIFGESISDTS